MNKILLIILAIIIIIGVGSCYFKKSLDKDSLKKDIKRGVINSVTFNCQDNKNIQAIFFADKVEITLSDRRNMLLPQAISASGSRYANSDESFVFWNKGDTAFIVEGDKTTHNDCVIAKS